MLLITGEAERGSLVGAAELERLAAHWNDAQVVAIRGAGHSVRRDRFDEYRSAVEAFLDGC